MDFPPSSGHRKVARDFIPAGAAAKKKNRGKSSLKSASFQWRNI